MARRFLSADYADCRRLWRPVLPLRGNSCRRFFRRLGQITADCRCLSRRCEGFFIRRFRRFTQIMAACLAAARQFTPPVFLRRPICPLIQLMRLIPPPVRLIPPNGVIFWRVIAGQPCQVLRCTTGESAARFPARRRVGDNCKGQRPCRVFSPRFYPKPERRWYQRARHWRSF